MWLGTDDAFLVNSEWDAVFDLPDGKPFRYVDAKPLIEQRLWITTGVRI